MSHKIASISPSSGVYTGPTTLSIFGSGFSTPMTVTIGTVAAESVTLFNETLIQCVVPTGMVPGVYDVTVYDDGDGGESDTLPNSYRVTIPLPDPPFALETRDRIRSRMLGNSSATWDKRQGSPFRDLIEPLVMELAKLYDNLDSAVALTFGQYTFGQYLELRAQEHGILRRAAVKATGNITVTGTNGTVLPMGTIVGTSTVAGSFTPGVQFETTERAVISAGTVTIPIIARVGGVEGNVEAGTIRLLISALNGISSIVNASACTGGVAIESDDDLRERLLRAVMNPVAGGTKTDYETWALEVADVGQATCIPLWDGPGTVKLVIVDADGAPAGSDILTAVKTYIDPDDGLGGGKAPIGATLTVVAPTPLTIDVVVQYVVVPGHDSTAVHDAIEAALTALIQSLKPGDIVRYTTIANTVHDTEGVLDYNSLTVNTGTSNITPSATEKPTVGTFSITED